MAFENSVSLFFSLQWFATASTYAKRLTCMKFNLDILKYHLFMQQGIPPERVNLETNSRLI